jgi:hypothetical protein
VFRLKLLKFLFKPFRIVGVLLLLVLLLKLIRPLGIAVDTEVADAELFVELGVLVPIIDEPNEKLPKPKLLLLLVVLELLVLLLLLLVVIGVVLDGV